MLDSRDESPQAICATKPERGKHALPNRHFWACGLRKEVYLQVNSVGRPRRHGRRNGHGEDQRHDLIEGIDGRAKEPAAENIDNDDDGANEGSGDRQHRHRT